MKWLSNLWGPTARFVSGLILLGLSIVLASIYIIALTAKWPGFHEEQVVLESNVAAIVTLDAGTQYHLRCTDAQLIDNCEVSTPTGGTVSLKESGETEPDSEGLLTYSSFRVLVDGEHVVLCTSRVDGYLIYLHTGRPGDVLSYIALVSLLLGVILCLANWQKQA